MYIYTYSCTSSWVLIKMMTCNSNSQCFVIKDSDDESGDLLPPITQLGGVSVYNLSSPGADHVTTLYGDRRFSRFGLVTQVRPIKINH